MGTIFYAKTAVFVCYFLWVLSMILVGVSGWEQYRTKRWMRGWDPTWHRRFAVATYITLWMNALCADGLHWLVRGSLGGEHNALFPLHVMCAFGLIVVETVMLFWLSGKKYPRAHGRLAMAGIPLSLVVAATGPILVLQL